MNMLKTPVTRGKHFLFFLLLGGEIFLIPSYLRAFSFKMFELQVTGKIIDIMTEDLNRDGRKDLLVIHIQGLTPRETRWLSLFWQREDNSFPKMVDQFWEMDRRATIVDIGDVDPAEGEEVIYLTGKGVGYYRLVNNTYIPHRANLIKTETMTVFPERDFLPYVNFVRDWNGDGSDDIAVFKFGELALFLAEPTYVFKEFNRLKVELDTSFNAYDILSKDIDSTRIPVFSATYRFPQITTRDINGDGRKDLVILKDDNLTYFLQREDGNFSVMPQQKRFNVRTDEEKREEFINLRIQADDLNRDGRADVLITKQRIRGLTSLIGRTIIFYNDNGQFPDTPDQVISTEGTASVSSIVRDINNDGKLDLILPTFRFGITDIVRYFLTQEIKVKFPIFLMGDDSRYSPRPDFERAFKFKIDLSGKYNPRVIDIDGDFNGDGRKDLALGTKDDRLSIFFGLKNPREAGMIFSSKAETTVEINTLAYLDTLDLTGNNRSDMIFFYPHRTTERGLIRVLVNRTASPSPKDRAGNEKTKNY